MTTSHPKQDGYISYAKLREVSGPEEVAQLGAEAGARTKAIFTGERFVRKPDGSIVFQAHKDSAAFAEHQAQEDEHLGWLGFSPTDKSPDFCFHKPVDSVIRSWNFRKVYTRPNNLRKAAEEFFAAYDSENADPNEVAKYLENLRAALEGK